MKKVAVFAFLGLVAGFSLVQAASKPKFDPTLTKEQNDVLQLLHAIGELNHVKNLVKTTSADLGSDRERIADSIDKAISELKQGVKKEVGQLPAKYRDLDRLGEMAEKTEQIEELENLLKTTTGKKERAVMKFNDPVKLMGITLKGQYLFVHDDAAMARGEACTYIYEGTAEINDKLVTSFHCRPAIRARVDTFTVRTVLTPSGQYELKEYQFAGNIEAHRVPLNPHAGHVTIALD